MDLDVSLASIAAYGAPGALDRLKEHLDPDVGRGCADVVGDDEHSPSTTTCGSGGVGS